MPICHGAVGVNVEVFTSLFMTSVYSGGTLGVFWVCFFLGVGEGVGVFVFQLFTLKLLHQTRPNYNTFSSHKKQENSYMDLN